MSDELKPCPFCGDKEIDLHEFGPNQWLAFCSPCGGQTTESGSPRDRAIAAWNRRSPTGGQEAGWRTIESAPVFRTILVGYSNTLGKWRSVRASYYPAGTLEISEESPGYYDSEDEFAPEGWYEETETHEHLLSLDCAPTHWMPLPEPPAAMAKEAGK